MMPSFPKPRARIFDKRDEQRDKERELRAVHAAVDARDLRRCRCCGRKGDPNATTMLDRIHRHHLQYRSKQGADTVENLVSLDAICHALVHAGQLTILGNDANERLTFEIHEAAVVEVFGNRPVPPHVHITTASRHLSE